MVEPSTSNLSINNFISSNREKETAKEKKSSLMLCTEGTQKPKLYSEVKNERSKSSTKQIK